MHIQINTNIPVFLSSDDNYAPYLSALMLSIVDNTDAQVDFYIIDAGISEFNKRNISLLQKRWNFGLEYIKADAYRHLFPLPTSHSGHITRASSDRFLIPHMKPELDKAIVLDVDMIALGDIRKLWEIDLEGKLLAAVPTYNWISMDIVREHVQNTGLSPKHVYFNMGTLIVNFKKWREDNILKKLSSTPIKFDSKKYKWWDEILINLILQDNNYKILEPKFNMPIPLHAYFKHGKPSTHRELVENYAGLSKDYRVNEIIFTHFVIWNVKPWNTGRYYYPPAGQWMEIPNFKDFWHYMKLTPFFEEEQIRYLTKVTHDTVWVVVKGILGRQEKKERAYRNYKVFKILNYLTLGCIPVIRAKKEMYKGLYKKQADQ